MPESWQYTDLRKALSTMELSTEEALQAIGFKPSLGDHGVGEALVKIENLISLIKHRLEKHNAS